MTQVSSLAIKGRVQLWVLSPEGQVEWSEIGPNLVTTQGKNWITKRLTEEAPGPEVKYMRGGDSAAIPSESHVDLQGTQTFSQTTIHGAGGYDYGHVVNNTILWRISYTNSSGAEKLIQEIGLFDLGAAPVTLMLARFLPTKIQLRNTGTFKVDWTLTVGGA